MENDGKPYRMLGSHIDITERKQTERALRENEQCLASIYNTVGDVIFHLAVEPDGWYRFTSINQAFSRVTGLPLQAVVGKRVNEIIPEPSLSMVLGKYRQAIEEKTIVRWEETSDYPTGRLTGEVSVAPVFDEAGNCTYLVGSVHDITEHKRAEEALRESEEKFSAAFHSSPVALAIATLDGKFVEANQAFCNLVGYSCEEIIGKTVTELGIVSVQAREKLVAAVESAGGSLSNAEVKFRVRDGSFRDILFSIETISFHGVPHRLSIGVDIKERKQAEEALRDSRNMLQTVLDSIPSAVFWKDRDSIYLGGNRTWLEAVGLKSLEEIVGKSDYDFPWEKKQADLFREYDRRIMESGIPEHDIIEPYRRADGTHAWAKTNKVPLRDTEGNVIGVLGTYEDITERKRAEDQLRSSREQLRALSARLQSLREEERALIAREIHDELGQTLTGLKMDLSWVSRKLPKDQKTLLEKMDSISKLIDTTIQTVRKISSELRPGVLDDLGLIAAIEWQAQDFQSRTGIKCGFNSSLETVELDRERSTAVFRICQETLTNVARHSNATRVIINVEESAGNLALEVDDNGKGISESEISNPKSLGLLGMKERAYIFGGELNIIGTQGKGTTVTVKIPFDSRDLKKQIPEISG